MLQVGVGTFEELPDWGAQRDAKAKLKQRK